MTTADSTGRYFADALDGRHDITDTYLSLGDIPDLIGISTQNEDEFVASIRRLIEAEAGGTDTITTVATPSSADAAELYHSNLMLPWMALTPCLPYGLRPTPSTPPASS